MLWGMTIGRFVRVCGQIGVMTMARNVGWTIGPCAAREYPVEPVGVEMIRPSALNDERYISPIVVSMSLILASAPLLVTTSFSTVMLATRSPIRWTWAA